MRVVSLKMHFFKIGTSFVKVAALLNSTSKLTSQVTKTVAC